MCPAVALWPSRTAQRAPRIQGAVSRGRATLVTCPASPCTQSECPGPNPMGPEERGTSNWISPHPKRTDRGLRRAPGGGVLDRRLAAAASPCALCALCATRALCPLCAPSVPCVPTCALCTLCALSVLSALYVPPCTSMYGTRTLCPLCPFVHSVPNGPFAPCMPSVPSVPPCIFCALCALCTMCAHLCPLYPLRHPYPLRQEGRARHCVCINGQERRCASAPERPVLLLIRPIPPCPSPFPYPPPSPPTGNPVGASSLRG